MPRRKDVHPLRILAESYVFTPIAQIILNHVNKGCTNCITDAETICDRMSNLRTFMKDNVPVSIIDSLHHYLRTDAVGSSRQKTDQRILAFKLFSNNYRSYDISCEQELFMLQRHKLECIWKLNIGWDWCGGNSLRPITEIRKIFARMKILTCLLFSYETLLTDQLLTIIGKSCHVLKELIADNVLPKYVTDKGLLRLIISGGKYNPICKTLEVLDLGMTNPPSNYDIVPMLLEAFVNLKTVNLWNVGQSMYQLITQGKRFSPRLEFVSCENTTVVEIDCLIEHCPSLTQIMFNQGPGKNVVSKLWKFEQLRFIYIWNVDADELRVLLTKQGSKIELLHFGMDAHVVDMSEIGMYCPNVRILSVTANMCYYPKEISFDNLRIFGLSSHNMYNIPIALPTKMISQMPLLEELMLCSLNEDSAKAIVQFGGLQNLQTFSIYGLDVTLEGLRTLIRNCPQIKCIKGFRYVEIDDTDDLMKFYNEITTSNYEISISTEC